MWEVHGQAALQGRWEQHKGFRDKPQGTARTLWGSLPIVALEKLPQFFGVSISILLPRVNLRTNYCLLSNPHPKYLAPEAFWNLDSPLPDFVIFA